VTGALPLSPRFVDALAYATEVHAGQSRKGTTVPYVAHVLGVCALVLEDGGGEDEAIAALLHDAVEDGGGLPVLEEVRRRFGDRVAEIVWACSDTYETPKPPWKQRKARYVAHVRAAGPDARRVSCADKLHNARSILRDYRLEGERLWDRFHAPPEEQLWYYRSLVEAFQQPGRTALVDELERVVGQLEAERKRVLGRSDLA
jgi:(p)ppGpp synthase/HD superfamily hydrolase